MKLILFLLLTSVLFAQNNKIKVAFEWKYQFQFAGYIAAKEKGFYKQAGFDVEFVEFENRDPMDMLLNAEVQYATSKSEAILNKMKGQEIVIVANFFKKSPLVFVTQEDIKNPTQFIGKRIMASNHELQSSNLGILLNKFGITPNDYTQINHTFSAQDFIDKKVPIMSAFLSNELYYLDKINYKYNIIDPANYGIFTYNENLITSTKYATRFPAKVKAFRDATIKGWKYALDHPEEIVNVIYNKYSKIKSKEALLYEAKKTKELVMSDVFSIGHIDDFMVQNIANTYVEMGLSSKYYNLDNFIFTTKKMNKDKTLHLSVQEKKYLSEIKEITMCINPNNMPYEGFVESEYSGISKDYYALIQKLINKPIRIIPTSSFKESQEAIRNNRCDILSFSLDVPKIREYAHVTKPIYKFNLALATKENIEFVTDIQEIVDKKVAVVEGSQFIELIKRKFPHAKLIQVKNIKDGFKLVEDGKAFAYLDSLHAITYEIQKSDWSLKINGKFKRDLELSTAVQKENELLYSILNKAASLINEKKRKDILDSWISVTYNNSFNYEILYKILIFLSILIAFIIYRYIILSSNNKRLQLLQDELNELNNSLQTTIDLEVQKSLKKDKFIQEKTKLAAMGEMVGAIAHQWRQPLNSISINIQNLDDDYDDGLINKEFINEFIEKQSNTIKFMSTTIDDFRNFFRVNTAKEIFSVHDAIQSTINIQSAQLINNNIEISLNGKDFYIDGFISEFQQVILNLIANAKDALVERKVPHAKIEIILDENTILVRDNAGGIEEPNLQKVFEPYFTTKDANKGTGLGLYMSKTIISQHFNGSLEIQNTENGAEFKISFIDLN